MGQRIVNLPQHFYKTYLENAAADTYIKQQIQSIGYDEERLKEGRAWQQQAWQSTQRQLRLKNNAK